METVPLVFLILWSCFGGLRLARFGQDESHAAYHPREIRFFPPKMKGAGGESHGRVEIITKTKDVTSKRKKKMVPGTLNVLDILGF